MEKRRSLIATSPQRATGVRRNGSVVSGGIPIISLFSGCGAFDLGFVEAGFQVVLALDRDESAVNTYNHNRELSIARVADLGVTTADSIKKMLKSGRQRERPRGVIGGAPCQSFSSANVHVRDDDSRHELPKKFASILKSLNDAFNLDFFVFENVRGLTYRKHKDAFEEFKRLFEEAGFVLFEDLLDAADFGVPQRRPRVFVVGLNARRFGKEDFQFPNATHESHLHVASVLQGLPEPEFFSRTLDPATIPFHCNHWAMRPKSPKFESGVLLLQEKAGRSFRVLDWNRPSMTVAYGNREVHVHPSGKRRLSVYEAMLLQGLPTTYELTGNLSAQIRQISDAVPPQLGLAIGTAIVQAIGTRERERKGRKRPSPK